MRVPVPPARPWDTRRSMPHRKAASVMPDPVGARMRVWSPPAMAGHPWAWAGVGAGKLVSNHAWTAGEKRGASTTGTLLRGYDREAGVRREERDPYGSRSDRTARGAVRAGGQAPRPLLACASTLPH